MLAFRSLLRQTRQRSSTIPRLASRLQHNTYGPHKEYFQNPNQQYYPGHEVPEPAQSGRQQQQITFKPRSRILSFLRSTFYAVIFLQLGLATGVALITWEYLQPPYEKGSEEDLELQEDILDTLDTCPIVESLREAGWVEEDLTLRPGGFDAKNGQHFVHQTLHGVQGINMKVFRHTSELYTILVFYPGFGCEGWPDVVHGGAVWSLFMDGIEKHLQNVVEDSSQISRLLELSSLNVDFKRKVKPGDIYTILFTPPNTSFGTLKEAQVDLPEGQPIWHLSLIAYLMQMEVAPRIQAETDPDTKTENHTIEIPTRGGKDATFAVAQADIWVESNEETKEYIEQLAEAKHGRQSNQSHQDLLNKLGAQMQPRLKENESSSEAKKTDQGTKASDKD